MGQTPKHGRCVALQKSMLQYDAGPSPESHLLLFVDNKIFLGVSERFHDAIGPSVPSFDILILPLKSSMSSNLSFLKFACTVDMPL